MTMKATAKAGDSSRISPTAEFTSMVWVRNGLSPEALGSARGRALYRAFRPVDRTWELLSGAGGLERYLLARHAALDAALARAVESREVEQVIEIAGGFSGRGLRFAARYGIPYIEGDLPHVVDEKRARLRRAGPALPGHEVVALDALADDGPASLRALAGRLAPARGTAVVVEGLLSYFDRPTNEAVFRRIGDALRRFPRGLALADVYVAAELRRSRAVRLFRLGLGAFVRGRTHTTADDDAGVVALLARAGLDATVTPPVAAGWARILEARPRPSSPTASTAGQ